MELNMTALDKTPENKNFLSPLNFKFTIKKAPYINFFVQEVNIPGVSLPPPETNNPFVRIPYPGEHLMYESLNIKFKVDEDLQNYLEIHNWIKGLGKPENYNQYKQISQEDPLTGEGIYSDISLIVLSSTKMPNYELTFIDSHPISLSDINFNTTDGDVNYITAQAKFRYTYFNIQDIA
jgi:hypothetical protein